MEYGFFRSEALKIFPTEAFASIEGCSDQKYAQLRDLYRKKIRKLSGSLLHEFPFDIFVIPSDSFFYIRDFIRYVQGIGKKVVVVQKETTISPDGMVNDSKKIAKYLPFISDYMAVCSERHKKFWINAGAKPDVIEVTGQPRFDFYVQPQKWKIEEKKGRRTILFFSYDLKAYIPEDRGKEFSWKKLREQTEQILIEFAKKNSLKVDLIIKPHPQQQGRNAEISFIKAMAGEKAENVRYITNSNVDTRQLIVNSDIIVGFQSTALIESMLLRKPIIYTNWATEFQYLGRDMIPFSEYSKAIHCCNSTNEFQTLLSEFLNNGLEPSDITMENRKSIFSEHLGPVDGESTERVFKVLEKVKGI